MQPRSYSPPPASLSTPAIVLALVLLGLLTAGGVAVVRTVRMVPGAAVPSQYVEQSRQRSLDPRNPAGSGESTGNLQAKPLFAGPGWGLMTRPQKLALYPLAERWDYMTEPQKRRWLALAGTFDAMPEEEQRRLHDRMVAWASLTAQQRSQARLTFATAKVLAPSDVLTQWEAYQALSEAQKSRLAASAPKPHGAATALKPVPSKRLVRVPAPTFAQSQSANPPKIVLPAATAIRVPAAPAPVELPPASATITPSAEQAPVQTAPESSDAVPVRPSDPLPELYVN